MATPNKKIRTELARQIRLMLGEGMIDIEPNPEHLELAIDLAFDRFRQRSANANEESYGFLELQPNVQDYILPAEVKSVGEIYRRGVAGLATGGGSYIDPFNLAYTNLYLLRSGDSGGLSTYDFFAQYQETVGRLFGLHLNFKYDLVTKKLTIMRKPTSPETVLLKLYNERPEEHLWADDFAKPWLRMYALAQTKFMMAEARSLFSQIPGPQGGTTLNGDQMKADAKEELERLDLQLSNYEDGSEPMSFVIG
ncbi:MAG: hypothetical protein HC836_23105 [Richelia sp. RM2_1_2]|nr:hypothetical protein [Richelia sp. RM2_1_2]